MADLTTGQGYAAMFAFLEAYYARTGANDIAALLGELQSLDDRSPADPAAMQDWEDAVAKVLEAERREAAE